MAVNELFAQLHEVAAAPKNSWINTWQKEKKW